MFVTSLGAYMNTFSASYDIFILIVQHFLYSTCGGLGVFALWRTWGSNLWFSDWRMVSVEELNIWMLCKLLSVQGEYFISPCVNSAHYEMITSECNRTQGFVTLQCFYLWMSAQSVLPVSRMIPMKSPPLQRDPTATEVHQNWLSSRVKRERKRPVLTCTLRYHLNHVCLYKTVTSNCQSFVYHFFVLFLGKWTGWQWTGHL